MGRNGIAISLSKVECFISATFVKPVRFSSSEWKAPVSDAATCSRNLSGIPKTEWGRPALIPDPSWAVPAKTWESVIDRYVHFRRVKAWRGRSRTADGSVNPNRLSRRAAVKRKQRLKARVSRLIDGGVLSARAYPLRQMMVEA